MESTYILDTGLHILNGMNARVELIRSEVEGKMTHILSSAGCACCQICTATFKHIHNLDIVRDGFLINRYISDLKNFLEDVNEEEFLPMITN